MKQFILRKTLIAFVVWCFIAAKVSATEGMWLPLLLEQLNEDEMKSMGLKITAKDIYDINNGSLKDAIVRFGNGCTAEIISDKGLLLTNHHCGYGQIQYHSSVEHDYLKDGFWAETQEDELANPGLTATFIVRIEDVTDKVLEGVKPGASESDRADHVKKNIEKIKEEAVKGTHYEAVIKPFFYGNKYYMFITETFKDVRLVAAPPSSIGKFGADTDNWMWPRHTGDFSIFRIYAGKDNKPAEFSLENVPYKPRKSLTISINEEKEGDFTMVYGFPGRTQEYLISDAVDYILNK
ncbi:MAG: serine protease, partial [Bacteroidetes bacterium]